MPTKKVQASMKVLEVLKKYPVTRKVFDKYGMGCRSCMGAAAESITAGAVTHGVDPVQMVKELNEAVGSKGR